MERYAEVLNYVIPFFMSLLVIERIAAWLKGKKVIHSMDTLSSLGSGLTNAIKDVLGLTFVIVSYEWMVEHLALFHIEATWLVYVLAFLGLDFAGYWNHRLAHQVNYFWNHHIIHHSSEEFNLACALRQSISNFFTIFAFLMIPTALMGIPAEAVAVLAPLHLFAQYWYHTRLIGKMGFLEKIIVTPSHHRVHHAINDIYLDKNLSQVFIIWDKLFGTFQEELDEVPPVYGVKRPGRTWNPVIINFYHLWQLMKDAWHTDSLAAKLKIWFMPTGWRPPDVQEKYPLESIEDVYAYEKYNPKSSKWLHIWSWSQFLATFTLMMYLFNNFAAIGFPGVLIYGLFLIFCIFSYSTLMDRSIHAWWVELIKAITGLFLIFYQGGWFLLDSVVPYGTVMVMAYFVIALVISCAFVWFEIRSGKVGVRMKVSQINEI
ncbi:MAG: sterol desaturase family protein [Cytophagales bacterium]|nr:sterol desaturase family protein [Cytophagales bacterium]